MMKNSAYFDSEVKDERSDCNTADVNDFNFDWNRVYSKKDQ